MQKIGSLCVGVEDHKYASLVPLPIIIFLHLNFDLLQLSGFMMEVVETAYAGHAKVLASTVDLNKCPDGNTNFVFFFCKFPSCAILFHYSICCLLSCLQVLYVLVAMEL
jgi:hypothetical protein